MNKFLSILIKSRSQLLGSPHISSYCITALKARSTCAKICVGAFLMAVAVMFGYRLVPFEVVPVLLGVFFFVFLVSAMLASRFGRLCTAEINRSMKTAIAHYRRISPACDAYYLNVKAQGRPFTRLDLAELRSMA